jgi:hypothetical protein
LTGHRIAAPLKNPAPRTGTFRQVRILLLLIVLLVVAVTTCETRYASTRWRSPLYVAIYPIAADESPVTSAYVEALDGERFKPIDRFFEREAKRYGVELDDPVKTRLRSPLHANRRSARRMPPSRRPCSGASSCASGPGV